MDNYLKWDPILTDGNCIYINSELIWQPDVIFVITVLKVESTRSAIKKGELCPNGRVKKYNQWQVIVGEYTSHA